LEEIWSHIAADNPDAADRMLKRISDGFERLSQFPRSGRSRSELAPGLRSYFIVPRHTVFYRVVDERIEVAHIIHHARDLARIFRSEN